MQLLSGLGASNAAAAIVMLAVGAFTAYAAEPPLPPYSLLGPRPTPEMVRASEQLRATLVEGWSMTAPQATDGEAVLAHDPENLDLRLRLMSYYKQHLKLDDHFRHASWLIRNHPDSDVFQRAATVTRTWAAGNQRGSAYFDRSIALWQEQAARLPHNSRVLGNAAIELASSDPALALEYVRAARQADPAAHEWTIWLAKIYADAIRWTFWDGHATLTFTGDAEDYRHFPFFLPLPMCETVKRDVEASSDADLVEAVGEAMLRESRLLEEKSRTANYSRDLLTTDVPQAAKLGALLVERARTLRSGRPE